MRVLSDELKKQAGKAVTVAGWLYKKRSLGGVMFVVLRDRRGLMQVVVRSEAEQEKLRGMQVGTVVEVHGRVKAEPRAVGGAEIHEPKITVLVPVEDEPPIEIDNPIDHNPENFDTLFENRVLNLRNLDEQRIFRVRAALTQALRDFLITQEFVEVQTPKLLAGATEGGAEVFKVDYFDRQAVLAQSPQLYKQIMAGVFERVFELAPAYRAEPSMTTRHMSEVTMLDIEMAFIDSHEDLLKLTEQLLYEVLTKVTKQRAEDLKALGAPPLKLKKQFPRFTVAEVHDLYSKDSGENTRKEKDLLPAEERWICDYAAKKFGCEAVFVTEFPVESMKFYHMINPDNPQTVLWADLLFRGVEIATIPQREHRYDVLVKQMKATGLDPEHPGFRYYLQAFKFGMPPHGGFGFGVDRLTQTVVGLSNVKEATLFPRDMNRLTP